MATNNSINNTSNPLSSTTVTVDPGSSGDSYLQLDINTTNKFRVGVDDTDDSFRISSGNALGTSDTMTISSSGEVNLPLQPTFQSTPSSTLSNVTGDGTTYTVVLATTVFDIGSDFDGTSTYTAPVAGVYSFIANIQGSAISSSKTAIINTYAAGSFTFEVFSEVNPGGGCTYSNSLWASPGDLVVELAASDTVVIKTRVTTTTKDVDILSSDGGTVFGGYLVA